VDLNGQLGRRSHDIHFGRYHLEQAADQEDFLRVLVSFEQQLPEGTDLLGAWELLYERSIGCVGIVKDWLTLAYRSALKAGAATISPEHLERTAPAADKAWRQLEEANLGERRLNSRTEARTRLRVALGLEDPNNDGSAASLAPDAPATPAGAGPTPRKPRPATASPRRPGQRRTVRDLAYASRPGPNASSESSG
jgi:hypothetical protein